MLAQLARAVAEGRVIIDRRGDRNGISITVHPKNKTEHGVVISDTQLGRAAQEWELAEPILTGCAEDALGMFS